MSVPMQPVWLSQGEADLPETAVFLSSREAERAARMRFRKRHDEFLLGRFTAKRAIARRLGLPDSPPDLSRIEIGVAPDGAPAPRLDGVPAPVAMSMTDRAGWAVCLVTDLGPSVGCDLELVEERSAGFVADFLTEEEQRVVAQAEVPEERAVLANLIWSAKESALKVLRTGLRRDTRSVEVDLQQGLDPEGWHRLVVTAVEGVRFPGHWRRFGPFLLTLAASVELPPPRSLTDPPGLAGALPTHSWLAR
jgi:4'-phosphopantetheinyl transferase